MTTTLTQEKDIFTKIIELDLAMERNDLENTKSIVNYLNDNNDFIINDNKSYIDDMFNINYITILKNIDSYYYAIENLKALSIDKKNILIFNIEMNKIQSQNKEEIINWIEENYLKFFEYGNTNSWFYLATLRTLSTLVRNIERYDILEKIQEKLKGLE